MTKLTIKNLEEEAKKFAKEIAENPIKKPDGKSIGTHFEEKFKEYLSKKYDSVKGSASKGIDFPDLNVDIKATSATKPQSSNSFKNPREQIYGLDHSLLIFIYQRDDSSGQHNFVVNNVVFVSAEQTSDKALTQKINKILSNKEENSLGLLMNCIKERNTHLVDDLIETIAKELLEKGSIVEGKIGISNTPQWRLRFSNLVDKEKKSKKVK